MIRNDFLATSAFNSLTKSMHLVAEYCRWDYAYCPHEGAKYTSAVEGVSSTGYCPIPDGGHVHFCRREKGELVELFLIEETRSDSKLYALGLVTPEYESKVKEGFFLAYE